MDIPDLFSTVPVHDRATDEVVIEVGREEVADLSELIEDGDVDAAWLLVAMFAEHIYAEKTMAEFVLNGVAMAPYVHTALAMVLDTHFDAKKAAKKVKDKKPKTPKTPKAGKATQSAMVTEEGSVPGLKPSDARIEMRPISQGGVIENVYMVMNDFEVFQVLPTLEDAEKALEHYPHEQAPRPDWMEPPEEYVPDETMEPGPELPVDKPE